MNYLAHLVLAEPTEDSQLGGLIGDFMSGGQLSDFAPGIRAGIERHRRIDAWTDAHPLFRRTRERLEPRVRRYSGVVADVVYDHFLAATWERWHPIPLPEFAAEVYASLRRRFEELPPRLQKAVPWIAGQDWLSRYGSMDHMERVFTGLARRVKRKNPLADAFVAFEENYDGLGADFAAFFPELRARLEEFDAAQRAADSTES